MLRPCRGTGLESSLRLYPKADTAATVSSRPQQSPVPPSPPLTHTPVQWGATILQHGPQVVCEHVKVGELGSEPVVMETTRVRRDSKTETALFENEKCGCCS